MDFDCIVAGTAEKDLRFARQFRPNAVVLDIGLPDQSGLTVLDRLKRDDETRHIPVHVISGTDHTQTALSLGAIGYSQARKTNDLAKVLQSLESELTSTMRRILILHEDPVRAEQFLDYCPQAMSRPLGWTRRRSAPAPEGTDFRLH